MVWCTLSRGVVVMSNSKRVWVCVVRYVPSTNCRGSRLRCQVGDNPPKFYGYHSWDRGNPPENAARQYMSELFPGLELEMVADGYGLKNDSVFCFGEVNKNEK